ncbi:MAG: alpha/beta hydrolase [Variibacter sp.]|nr:alpha/beta hydrolase [Variibacter sp.]
MALVSTIAIAPAATAAPIPAGQSAQTVSVGAYQLVVHTYRPNCQNPSLLLVLHGANRKPESSLASAIPLADRLCLIAVAPHFDKERFKTWAYQQGGIVHRHRLQDPRSWTGRLALGIVAWAQREERRAMPFYLIGHSAGGQFLSRLAAYMPSGAVRIIIANPSTYVLPTTQEDAPFGFGGMFPPGMAEQQIRAYLAQPITIVLGDADLGDKQLNQSPEGMRQGRTRYERGLNAYWTARRLAESRGWAFNWQIIVVPGVGHNAKQLYRSPNILPAFSPPRAAPARTGYPSSPRNRMPSYQAGGVPGGTGTQRQF